MQKHPTQNPNLQDYKLCGFSRIILSLTSPSQSNDLPKTLPFATLCHLHTDESNKLGFRTENNLTLSLIQTNSESEEGSKFNSTPISGNAKALEEDNGDACLSATNRKLSRFGFVNGSMSVVHQIHALKVKNCVEIVSRVVEVSVNGSGNVRVAVLVDVYLPLAVWNGWQFPKLGLVAAALFRHLRCKEWCRLPIITPCRHLLCLDCVAMDSQKCTFPGCGNLYEMQSPETLARPENPNPKWPVPKDLIELQPSYKQDDWDPDWHATSSSKVAYLVERLKDIQVANKKLGYSLNEADLAEPSGTHFLPSQKIDCDIFLHHEVCTQHDHKPFKTPPLKVIIFSQFLEHIHVIEQQLTGSGIKFAGMYSPMHSSNKMKSLTTFQHDENCMALLMDGSAALGLDLSFVTHVFLMEPIWDGSMEEQVISRAHRMGATRPINVETLAMHGTIEEQMLNFLKDSNRQTLKDEFGKTDREGGRPHHTLHDFAESNYLAQLSFVRTN